MNLILTNSFKHFSDLADKLNYENLDLKRGPLTSSFSKKFAYFNIGKIIKSYYQNLLSLAPTSRFFIHLSQCRNGYI